MLLYKRHISHQNRIFPYRITENEYDVKREPVGRAQYDIPTIDDGDGALVFYLYFSISLCVEFNTLLVCL